MTRKPKYDPNLTIKENAKRLKITERGVEKYMQRHGYSRREKKLYDLLNELKLAYGRDPETTPYGLAKATKHSVNTVSKYWPVVTGETAIEDYISDTDSRGGLVKHREYNNYYATHPSVTRDLLRVESFNNEILEPFCGGGYMSREIQAHGHSVLSYDIADRGCGGVADFATLEVEQGRYDIISNPPYDKHTVGHILKAIAICKGKVAMLLPLHYLTSRDRYTRLFGPFPPSRIWVYTNRIIIARNGDFDTYKDQGTNLTIYAWFVWERGFQGVTRLKWIENIM